MERPFDAILFDLGSTLIYFDGEWPQVFSQANVELITGSELLDTKLKKVNSCKTIRNRIDQYHSERESEFIEYTTAFFLRSVLADWGYPQVPQATIQACLRAMYAVSQAHWHIEVDTLPTLEYLAWSSGDDQTRVRD